MLAAKSNTAWKSAKLQTVLTLGLINNGRKTWRFLYRQKISAVFYNIFHKFKCLKCMELLPFISHVSKIYVLQISLSPNVN